jgi:hypothetical protein
MARGVGSSADLEFLGKGRGTTGTGSVLDCLKMT